MCALDMLLAKTTYLLT